MYKNMPELLEERENNGWKLEKFEIKQGNFRAMVDGIMPGTYIRLTHNGKCVMSDTDMEQRTNLRFCLKAHGDIVVGGLGIGMIIMAIQDKPEVKSIICADVFEWKPERGVKYDMAYMDIWNWINEDVYKKEMQPLKRKYARFLRSKDINPNRFNECWAEYQAKNGRRLA